jgi:hypothetical protein
MDLGGIFTTFQKKEDSKEAMTALKYLPWTHFRFCYQFCYLNQIPGYLSSFLLLTPTPLTYHILLWLLVLFHITLGGHSSSDKGLGWA